MSKICEVVGCENLAKSKHLCQMHYARKKRHGDVGGPDKTTIGIRKNFQREYYSYNAMKIRCYCKSHKQYKNYGGRGIKVCDRWLGEYGFRNFLKDMGKRPEGDYSLDRINPDGNYEPNNCRWATRKMQSENKSSKRYLEYRGEKHTIKEWAEILNIPDYVIYNRLYLYKWSADKALSTQYKKRK